MKNYQRTSIPILRWLSIGFVFAAVLLTVFLLIQFSRIRDAYPPGLIVAGVPVGGLNQQQAAERLVQAYSIPVEVRYNEAIIQFKPAVVGFELDISGMLAAAEQQRGQQAFWPAFWDYLWARIPKPTAVPLRSRISEERLRAYLTTEIAQRYDQRATSALPVPGSPNFEPGVQGTVLDVDRAVLLIEDALRSPAARTVSLTFSRVNPPRPSMQNLQVLLSQIIDLSRFEGVTEMYLLDLQTNQELHFAYQQGKKIAADIAFTAASTMKIPIMISTFRQSPSPMPQEQLQLLTRMIEFSENDPADALMERLNKISGPLEVTKDIQALGMKSTFLAGYFYPGAQLLKQISTPANTRKDVFTDPDRYNQTTPAEMGQLLDDIYQCADSGGGAFAAVFPGQILQSDCKQMINLLILNRLPALISAGLPDGTTIAHKHGWISEVDGLLHTISDAGIIYSPGGNYVLTIYLWDPVQLLFNPTNQLVADLSNAIYNYFNPSSSAN